MKDEYVNHIDYRYEMIYGEEVAKFPQSYKHFVVQNNLMDIFDEYLKNNAKYKLFRNFVVRFEKDHWFEPDFFIISDRAQIKNPA